MLRQILKSRASLKQLSKKSLYTLSCKQASASVCNSSFNLQKNNGWAHRHLHRSCPSTQIGTSLYESVYPKSIADADGFWGKVAKDIDWIKNPSQILDDSNPPFTKWFPDGELNTCYNCLDRHVERGRANQMALIYDSPITGKIEMYTYSALLKEVSKFAFCLTSYGVKKGDRVVIYMPMIPQAVIAMLACARVGAVHSVVFGGFAANELARRIDHAEPKMIVTASCGIEPQRTVPYKPLLDEALQLCQHSIQRCIVVQRPQVNADLIPGRDYSWDECMAKARPFGCVKVKATDPLYILYTSGTTGDPKGIVRDQGGHAVVLNWTMKSVYGINPGEVWWAASDLGWVVGHSYIVYAPLLAGCTTVLYEGKPVGTPDVGAFFRVIEQHKVASMFTAPTAIRVIRHEDPQHDVIKKYDLSGFRAMFVAGEHLDKDTMHWCRRAISAPVYDNWWQTETGWPITAHSVGLGKPMDENLETTGKAVPGYNVQVIKEDMTECKRGDLGQIVIKMPLPPGTASTLWRADERFKKSYFEKYPGYYDTSDAGVMDKGGYISVMARTDDVINISGHRISTKALEEVMLAHTSVVDAAVVGYEDKIKGLVPLGFIVLERVHSTPSHQIIAEVVQLVRENIGPVAAFKNCVVVHQLPKTRSGKTLRSSLSNLANAKAYKISPTVENPQAFDEIRTILQAEGFLE